MATFAPIICFFGPDGSGKSSISQILVKRLTECGFRVKLSWMRGTHTVASIFARFFSKFAVFRGSDNFYYGISIPKRLRRFWQILEFFSVLPVLLVKFFLPSILGKTVIAERYLLDFITWVSIETDDSKYLQSFESRFLLALVSKTKVNVYVTADFAVLSQRRTDSRGFLQKQLSIYEDLAKSVGAFKLDTSEKTANESAAILLAFISQKVKINI
jgi:hypothetical protein